MRHRNTAAFAGSLALVAALAGPASAQDPTLEVVADGLDTPRGLTIGSDGSIWVAAAGTTGDTCMDDVGLCFGPTGSILRVTDGTVETVIDGLPSVGNAQEVGGVSDVALIDDDEFYFIMNLGADPAVRQGMPAELETAGWLMRGSTDGSSEPVADVAAFESSNDPDAEFSGGLPDSNPFSIAIGDGGVAVADAGGNDVLLVDDTGTVSLMAFLPPTMHDFPAALLEALGPPPEGEGGPPAEGEAPPADGEAPAASDAPAGEAPADGESMASEAPSDGAAGDSEMVTIPIQSVPTGVVVGPDGAYYVGELTGGPFPVGGASVYRIAPGEEPTQYATGFTNIIDLGFAPDGTLYVAEIVHDGLMGVFTGEAAPIGAVLSVPPGGGDPSIVVTGEQVMAPGGLAVDGDGNVYVSTGTMTGPGTGAIVKITP